ncbi:hypothetical protein [uncultured Pontibacter sp.]|uniref:hypothetical protein n=1 Tax=uncultured Pontibacter sp. TaxID=453356 RepID=UPI0026322D4E|nr:hypothetical protein [uncultured Pontibacter sp.]
MEEQAKCTKYNSIGKHADALLLLLFFAFAAAILFRVQIESTGYLSPDSVAYLGLAQNLLDGHGFYVLNTETNSRQYFSTWPVGYPVLIFILSKTSGLSVFWASKALNLLFLGSGFLLLRKLCRAYAFILASVFGAYTFIEVYSFTWSEAPFLIGVLLLAYLTNKSLQKPEAYFYAGYIFLLCLLLFLVRYVGAFSFGVPGLLCLYFLYKRHSKTGILYGVVTLLLTILAGLYLYNNYRLSGYTTGFDRLAAPTESISDFLQMLAQGLSNEFFIIRKYRSASQPDYLFYATALLQIAVLVYLYASIKPTGSFTGKLGKNSFALCCFAIAGLYFVAILILRQLSHFDDLDYRLLSPVIFLVLIGLVYTLVTLSDDMQGAKCAKYVVLCFFVLSLLLNLPKEFLLAQLKHLI